MRREVLDARLLGPLAQHHVYGGRRHTAVLHVVTSAPLAMNGLEATGCEDG